MKGPLSARARLGYSLLSLVVGTVVGAGLLYYWAVAGCCGTPDPPGSTLAVVAALAFLLGLVGSVAAWFVGRPVGHGVDRQSRAPR